MEFLTQFSIPVVIGICLCVGYILKNVVTTDKVNKFIPLIMGVLGLGLNMWINLGVSPEIILGGLVSGLASTGLYEAFRQFIKK
jgi:uncharacterized protein YebE (UPF0316 family)